MSINFSAGYSADVEMTLLVRGVRYALTHAAADYLRLKSPAPLPAGSAEIIVSVDGRETRRYVDLLQTTLQTERKIRFIEVERAAPVQDAANQ